MNSKITGLEDKLLNQIVSIILEYKNAEKIVIFGSRAKGISSRTSDIDLAIFGKNWTDRDINLIKNKLEELMKTPYKLDVVNFYLLKKDTLKQNIIKEGRVLYESRKN